MPPKAKRSKQDEPRFLFVNEDAKTVTRVGKDAELDREKQSHVQRQNFAKRKQAKEQAVANGSEAPSQLLNKLYTTPGSPPEDQDSIFGDFDAFVSVPLSDPEFFKSHSSQPNWQFSQITATSFRNAYQPGRFFESAMASQGLESTIAQLDFPSIGSLLHFPLQARTVHPLFSGPAQILEKWAPPLIQHYNTVVLPEKFFADTQARPLGQTRHASAIHADTADAMSEPAHLYAFLASAAAHMLCREGQLVLPDLKAEDYHSVPIFFKTKAMEALRQSLAKGAINHALVMDVHRLIATAYFSNAYDAADPHFQAMMSMIESLGGISTFSDYFEEVNILLDWSAGLKRLSPARLPLNWDPGHGSYPISETLGLLNLVDDGLGTRMFQIFEEMRMRPVLTDAFADLVEVTRFHRWTRNQPTYDPAHFRYLLLRHIAIGCRLLAMSPDPTTTDQEEALRIALIFWTALTRSPSSGKRCASTRAHQLRASLEASGVESKSSIWQNHMDWLLWIAVVGGLTATRQTEYDWFARLAAKTARRVSNDLGEDLGEMETLLCGFLYEPSLQREPLLDFMTRMHLVGKG